MDNKMLKLGNTEFNCGEVSKMTYKQFEKTYKDKRYLDGHDLKELYESITSKKVGGTKKTSQDDYLG